VDINKWREIFNKIEEYLFYSQIIILGDFNAQHTSWRSTINNYSGKILNRYLSLSTYTFLNSVRVQDSLLTKHMYVIDLSIVKSFDMEYLCLEDY